MKVKRLTKNNIRPYGRIIDGSFIKDDGAGNKFGVLLREPSKGWRIGYLILRDKFIGSLERHKDSPETFEPMKGRAVIALAKAALPDSAELFYLDKPVVVNKNIWHDVLAISRVCEIKIFENIEVKTERYSLNNNLVI